MDRSQIVVHLNWHYWLEREIREYLGVIEMVYILIYIMATRVNTYIHIFIYVKTHWDVDLITEYFTDYKIHHNEMF